MGERLGLYRDELHGRDQGSRARAYRGRSRGWCRRACHQRPVRASWWVRRSSRAFRASSRAGLSVPPRQKMGRLLRYRIRSRIIDANWNLPHESRHAALAGGELMLAVEPFGYFSRVSLPVPFLPPPGRVRRRDAANNKKARHPDRRARSRTQINPMTGVSEKKNSAPNPVGIDRNTQANRLPLCPQDDDHGRHGEADQNVHV